MAFDGVRRHVVVLAPMPLEMEAIVTAFSLRPTTDIQLAPWTGRLGDSAVTAVHIGMGPPSTRAALHRLLDSSQPAYVRVDHVMNAGICGGLHPNVDVGTLINPEIIVDDTSGAEYRHAPPGGLPRSGKLRTMETATLDHDKSRLFYEDGFVALDMESAAVAEVCEAQGVPWSIYRCIGDRYFDGLLDERLIAATNQDGSGDMRAIHRLLQAEPDLGPRLERLHRDTANAARIAAEAAVRGCLALDND
jgi:nucleoside phosphorylase